ncbi:MAG TPA: hypothetical protein VMH04_18300 [Candidatus Solibacter sp.]|nr:hypothetical protein [Candidatus Solibacter sp.]
MQKPKSSLRSELNPVLNQRLIAYATAGAAMLAAVPAQGKVIYTATNTQLDQATTTLDLNHDGIADFTFGFHELDKAIVLAVAPAVQGNEMLQGQHGVGVGFFGVPVGPGGKFKSSSGEYGWGSIMAVAGSYSVTYFFGPWANATNRYMGLKFLINGQVHYGWARLTVPNLLHGGAVLTGYAYETTPNTKIIDGHTSGATAELAAPEIFPVQPPTLGMLARGTDGLAIWRRENEVLSN